MMMTYRIENGWNLPNLTPPQEPPVTGKYALMRERYLIEHQRSLYHALLFHDFFHLYALMTSRFHIDLKRC